jgi:hypothetical protein
MSPPQAGHVLVIFRSHRIYQAKTVMLFQDGHTLCHHLRDAVSMNNVHAVVLVGRLLGQIVEIFFGYILTAVFTSRGSQF